MFDTIRESILLLCQSTIESRCLVRLLRVWTTGSTTSLRCFQRRLIYRHQLAAVRPQHFLNFNRPNPPLKALIQRFAQGCFFCTLNTICFELSIALKFILCYCRQTTSVYFLQIPVGMIFPFMSFVSIASIRGTSCMTWNDGLWRFVLLQSARVRILALTIPRRSSSNFCQAAFYLYCALL